MRTTLDLEDNLFHADKELAVKTRRSLRAVVEEALREKLLKNTTKEVFRPAILPVSNNTGGLLPGIDLDNSADMLDAMEPPRGLT